MPGHLDKQARPPILLFDIARQESKHEQTGGSMCDMKGLNEVAMNQHHLMKHLTKPGA